MLYKKGHPADCGNYRPICLLAAAYKLFSLVLLLQRLLRAGAEEKLWPSQFGFRRGCGTDDALFCMCRAIELAWSQRDGAIYMLALDLQKAFDSIHPSSLMQALLRFRIPGPFAALVGSIYEGRVFRVSEGAPYLNNTTREPASCLLW